MIVPLHPTEHYILGQISFHEEGEQWYRAHEQTMLAAWSRATAEEWRGKLKPLNSMSPAAASAGLPGDGWPAATPVPNPNLEGVR